MLPIVSHRQVRCQCSYGVDDNSLCGDVVMSSRQPELPCVRTWQRVLSIQTNTNVPATHQPPECHEHPTAANIQGYTGS